MTKAALKERTAPLFGEIDPPAKPKAEVAKVAKPKAKKKTGTAVAVHKPSPPLAPKSLLEVIKDAAADPRVDVAKMQALLTMAREEEARAAEREFNVALAEAQAEMPRVTRDAKSDKHKYVRLETVTKLLDPLIARNNFSLSFGMSNSPMDEHYRITAALSHKSGHKRDYFIDLPADTKGAKGNDNKTAVQGIGSTISYGRRYLTLMIFNVAVRNEDDDGAGGEPAKAISAEQIKDLRAKLTAANITDDQFCGVYKIEKVDQLPAAKLANALDRIAQKQRATS